MSAIADYPLPQQRSGRVHGPLKLKQLEEMFTSVQVNRFLFRVKERPQGNTIVAQKTVQSKRICLVSLHSGVAKDILLEAYSFTLNGKMFRSGPERYLKKCLAE